MQLQKEQDKIKKVENYLSGRCTIEIATTRRSRRIKYYVGEKEVFAVAPLPKNAGNGYTLMDREIYDKCFADGRGSLSFVRRNHESYKVIAHLKGNGQIPLHRLVMREKYGDEMLKGADVVDHKFMSTLINTAEALRFATYSQNRQNSRRSRNLEGEFAYNPRTDLTDTWDNYVMSRM